MTRGYDISPQHYVPSSKETIKGSPVLFCCVPRGRRGRVPIRENKKEKKRALSFSILGESRK
jgi:hypothetical protein